MSERILRSPEVEARTGLGKSERARRIKHGEFPAPIPLGTRAVGWLESDIERWIAGRVEAARQSPPRGPAVRRRRS